MANQLKTINTFRPKEDERNTSTNRDYGDNDPADPEQNWDEEA